MISMVVGSRAEYAPNEGGWKVYDFLSRCG